MSDAAAFVIDVESSAVLWAGERRKVEPKVLACLELLWRYRNRLVTSAHLRSHVWPDATVGDGSLPRVIGKARAVVRGSGLTIRSRKGLGYVLDAPGHEGVDEPGVVRLDDWPFVGRTAQLAALRELCRGGEAAPSVVVLHGEAGSGKSALLTRALDAAPSSTWRLRGRCLPGLAVPAFWAWDDLLGRHAVDPELASRLARHGPEFPAAGGVAPGALGAAEHPPGADDRPLHERRREQCQDFARLLARVVAPEGAVLALEDLHWADEASLQVAEEVAAVAGGCLRLIVSYRSGEHPESRALEVVHRRLQSRGALVVSVDPLDVDEVRAILECRRFPWASPEDAEALCRATGGNPLFVRQWLHHLSTRIGSPSRELPRALPHVIEARLSHLGESVRALLRYAAVLGEEIPAALLDDLDAEGLGRALRSGLLEHDVRANRYRFHHALVRDAIHEGLSSEERRHLHAAAFRAWQALPQGSARRAALAAHGAGGLGLIPAAVVRSHAERAGFEAFEAHDFARAARHLDTALRLTGPQRLARRAYLALWVARASWHADEAHAEVAQAYQHAMTLARQAGSPQIFAEAAIGGAIGEDSPLDLADARARAGWAVHLEEAFHRLEGGDAGLRHRVASALCWMRGTYGDWEGARAAARHVRERDPESWSGPTRIQALGIDCVADLWSGKVVSARSKLPRLVDACDDSSMPLNRRIEGHIQVATLALMLGDLGAYRASQRVLRGLSDQVPDPFRAGRVGWRQAIYKMSPQWLAVGLAVIEGELAEAGRRLAAMADLARRIGVAQQDDPSAAALVLLPVFAYQGRCQMLGPLLAAGSSGWPDELSRRAASLRIELERRDAAAVRTHLDRLRELRFSVEYAGVTCSARPYDLVCMADACVFVGDVRAAESIHALLWPWREQFVGDGISLGAVARPLGNLARCLGDADQAEHFLRLAVSENKRFGHRPERVRTELELASLVRARGRYGQADRIAGAARREAAAMGLKGPNLAEG